MLDPDRLTEHRQSLADALRALRRASGLSGERLAKRVNLSQSKISKIENGRLLPSVIDVERIVHALGVDPSIGLELIELAKLANTEFRTWRSYQRLGLHHKQAELATLEASSARIRYFLPAMITGLLQTPEYARRTLLGPIPQGNADPARAISARLERQQILYDETRRFEFVLTESALRWRLCQPAIMAVQLDRLVSLSTLNAVDLRIVPLNLALEEGPLNGFVIYDRRLVTVETFSGEVVLRNPTDVDYHCQLFTYFAERALSGAAARTFLTSLADEHRQM